MTPPASDSVESFADTTHYFLQAAHHVWTLEKMNRCNHSWDSTPPDAWNCLGNKPYQLAHPLDRLSLTDLQQDAVATLAQGGGGCQASSDRTRLGAWRKLRVDPPADLHEQNCCDALCRNIDDNIITAVVTTRYEMCTDATHCTVCNRDEPSRDNRQSAAVLTTLEECNSLCDYMHAHTQTGRGTDWLREQQFKCNWCDLITATSVGAWLGWICGDYLWQAVS